MSRLSRRGLRWNDLPLRQKSFIVVAVPLLSLLFNSFLFYLRHQVEENAENWVTHSLNVRVEIARLLPEIFEAQRYARMYGALGKKADLLSYQAASEHLQQSTHNLKALVADRPSQLAAAKSLERAVSERLIVAAELARASPKKRIDEQELNDRMAASTQFIRNKSHEMEAEETLLLQAREQRLEAIRRADYMAVAGTMLIGLLGGLVSMRLLIIGILRRTEDLQVAVGLIAEGREWRPVETANDEIGYVAQGLARTGELLGHRANAMHEAMAKLEAVLNAATQFGIIGADCEGNITLFNTGAERMFGYPAAEVLGRPLVETLHLKSEVDARVKQLSECCSADLEPFEALVLTVDTQGFDEREWTLVRKDRSLLAADVVITPQRDSRNQLIGFLFVARDISQQKEAENLLRDAKRKAEEASLAKSQFLACMSHEIRTPMNAICGMADLLLETKLDEEQREYTKIFRASSDWLLKLINDILDLSKVESGKLDLELLPFSLEEAVEQTVELIAPQAHRKGLEMASEISGQVPLNFVGDRQRLQQILFNLLGNAVKFTDAGEVVLRVEMKNEGLIQFSVSDTGKGISDSDAERIFDPFQQADASISRRFGGTGLGLAITKGLVETMHGRIWVESRPGSGCTFSFVVPHQPLSREEHYHQGDRFNGLKALVVDDSAIVRDILQKTLSKWGIEAEEAANGGDALMRLRAGVNGTTPYSLLLVDRMMPGSDGLEVARAARQIPGLESLPTFVLAAEKDASDVERAREIDVQILSKPVKRSKLLEAIEQSVACPVPGKAHDPKKTPEALLPLTGQRDHILVVDDTPPNVFLIKAYLKGLPYEIFTAFNGAEAFELSKGVRYDLILMDVQMPEVDGYTATGMIRREEKSRGLEPVPIIALTASALKGEAERSKAAGCTGYLSKPVRREALLEAMQTAIAQSRQSQINPQDATRVS